VGQNECLKNILKQCGGNNVVMLRIFKGVTGYFKIKVQMITQTIEHEMTKEKPRPENHNKLFVPEAWC